MIFNDETDDIWDEMAIARRLFSHKDKMQLANEYLKALVCEELSQDGFENEDMCNLEVVACELKGKGFVMGLMLGKNEPEITIRKQGRKRKRWIDRR